MPLIALAFRRFCGSFINLSSALRVPSRPSFACQSRLRQIITRGVFVLSLPLLLGACSSDYANELVGTWKDVNNERYLTLEENGEVVGGMNAVIYAPVNPPDEVSIDANSVGKNQVAMNHLSMPAIMHDGVLMLEVDAGYIPVLYDPTTQRVLLNGTDHYEKIPEEVAQLALNPGGSATTSVAHN